MSLRGWILIEPFGIETIKIVAGNLHQGSLIEPFGIETSIYYRQYS